MPGDGNSEEKSSLELRLFFPFALQGGPGAQPCSQGAECASPQLVLPWHLGQSSCQPLPSEGPVLLLCVPVRPQKHKLPCLQHLGTPPCLGHVLPFGMWSQSLGRPHHPLMIKALTEDRNSGNHGACPCISDGTCPGVHSNTGLWQLSCFCFQLFVTVLSTLHSRGKTRFQWT